MSTCSLSISLTLTFAQRTTLINHHHILLLVVYGILRPPQLQRQPHRRQPPRRRQPLLSPSFGLIGSEMILVSSMKSFLSTCSRTHRGQVPPLRIVVSDSDVLSLTYTSVTAYSPNIIVHSFLRQEVLLLEVRRLHGGRWRHFQYSDVVLS
jgi:hypothetical protein